MNSMMFDIPTHLNESTDSTDEFLDSDDAMSDDDSFPVPFSSFPEFSSPALNNHSSSPSLFTPFQRSPPELSRFDYSPFDSTPALFSPTPFGTPRLKTSRNSFPLPQTPVTPAKDEKHVKLIIPTPDFSTFNNSTFSSRKLNRTASSNGTIPETPKKRGTARSRLAQTPKTAPPQRAPIHSPTHFAHAVTPKVKDTEISCYFENHFDQVEKIGAGSFSNVFKVRCIDDNALYAIKILKRPLNGDTQRQKLIQELKIVKQMDHPHVLNYIFCWEQNEIPHFQMEMCSGGSLSHYMTSWQKNNQRKFFDESLLWKFFTDIALGLHHIHSNGIIHHDIKPGNIFVDSEGNLKIGDFGLANFELSGEIVEGDSRYLAPEVLDDVVSKAVDIFSLGATIFELSCLIEMPNADEQWNLLRSGNVSKLPNFPDYSAELKNVVDAMMHPKPSSRPTIEQILTLPQIVKNIETRNAKGTMPHIDTTFTPTSTPSFISAFNHATHEQTRHRTLKPKRNLMNQFNGIQT